MKMKLKKKAPKITVVTCTACESDNLEVVAGVRVSKWSAGREQTVVVDRYVCRDCGNTFDRPSQ